MGQVIGEAEELENAEEINDAEAIEKKADNGRWRCEPWTRVSLLFRALMSRQACEFTSHHEPAASDLAICPKAHRCSRDGLEKR